MSNSSDEPDNTWTRMSLMVTVGLSDPKYLPLTSDRPLTGSTTTLLITSCRVSAETVRAAHIKNKVKTGLSGVACGDFLRRTQLGKS